MPSPKLPRLQFHAVNGTPFHTPFNTYGRQPFQHGSWPGPAPRVSQAQTQVSAPTAPNQVGENDAADSRLSGCGSAQAGGADYGIGLPAKSITKATCLSSLVKHRRLRIHSFSRTGLRAVASILKPPGRASCNFRVLRISSALARPRS